MATDYYFATPLHIHDLGISKEVNAKLLKEIFAWQKSDPQGIIRSNLHQAGAWHSQLNMHELPQFNTISRHIIQQTGRLFDTLHYDTAFSPVIDSMWANINPRHAHNRSHIHPDTLWSGVYYVQAPPNCGRISFSDPRVQARVITPHYSTTTDRPMHSWPEIYFDAITGRLILFPAWLAHEVEPNLTTHVGEAENRVSISFNIYQGRPATE